MTATEVTQARKYLTAYTAQHGEAQAVGCGMATTYRFLPAWALDGIPTGTSWVEAGRMAAERVAA